MAEHVIITEGSGMNVIPIDAFIKKTATNDANVALQANTYYELGSPSLQTLTLPLMDKDGDIIGISGVGSGGFKIIQTIASHQILFGNTPTTLGTFGTLETAQINSVLYLRRLLATGLYLASTPQGEFLIDAAGSALLNNAINDTSKVSDLVLTSTGNNVQISGSSPNIDLNVGKPLSGISAIAITNQAPVAHGNNSTSFGHSSGANNQGAEAVANGHGAGQDNQGAEALANGFDAGKTSQGAQAVANGHSAGKTNQGAKSLALGAKAAENGCADNSVNLGFSCVGTLVNGRLAFGSAMEAITATGTTAGAQTGYINTEWNGVLVRTPAFVGTMDEPLVTGTTTTTFTNKTFDANGTGNSLSNVDVADLADGIDGELITWGATGAPATVAAGTSGQVLTSNGPGEAPTFQSASYGSIYQNFGVETIAVSSTVWKLLDTGSFFSGPLNNFTVAATRLTYTGSSTEVFRVTYDLTLSVDSTDTFSISIFKNSGPNPEQISISSRDQDPDDDRTKLSVTRNIELANGGFIEPFIRRSTNGNFIYLEAAITISQSS